MRDDGCIHGFAGERNGEVQVSAGEPVPAEVSGMDDARHALTVGNVMGLHVLRFRVEDQAVHGVFIFVGIVCGVPICRQRELLSVPLGCDRFSVGRELAQNAVGEGSKKRSAATEACVAVEIVRRPIGHFGLQLLEGGGPENRNLALAGDIGADLIDIHAAAGDDGHGHELRFFSLGRAVSGQGDQRHAADLQLWGLGGGRRG